jgi:hypothetical protein
LVQVTAGAVPVHSIRARREWRFISTHS